VCQEILLVCAYESQSLGVIKARLVLHQQTI